jgi:hypothetical protein
MQIRLGDVDVVAEHLIVAHLEGADAGPRPFAGFVLAEEALAVQGERSQLVDLGVAARLYQLARPRFERRVVGERAADPLAQLGQ